MRSFLFRIALSLILLLCMLLQTACGSGNGISADNHNLHSAAHEVAAAETEPAAGNKNSDATGVDKSMKKNNNHIETKQDAPKGGHSNLQHDGGDDNPKSPTPSASKPGTPKAGTIKKEDSSPGKKPDVRKEDKPSAAAPKADNKNKSEPASEEHAAKVYVVEIVDFAFSPSKLDIKAGDIVKFINKDEVRHSATADDDSFDTGLLGQDEAKPITFTKAGEFSYFCSPHPAMKGTIVVTADK